jgi:cell division protein FtsL
MIRVLNFLFVAITGLVCLALYHVSEQARSAGQQLAAVNKQIVAERAAAVVIQADWSKFANPERIQQLAQTQLGLDDTPVVELSSLDLLPRNGEAAPLADQPVRNANVIVPTPRDPNIRTIAARTGM